MGTLLASALISQASEIVQDESNVVWTTGQGLAWLNDAQRTIASVKPDSSQITRSLLLQEGTKQTVAGLRLMRVIRNMGADGSTPGRAIRLVERGLKDDFEEDWHIETASSEIKEYIYDFEAPSNFYVSPPPTTNPAVYIEVVEHITPDDVATINDPITLDNIYAPTIIEWIIYKFLSRDSEETPNWQVASAHAQQFYSMLGVEMQQDVKLNPKTREHLK